MRLINFCKVNPFLILSIAIFLSLTLPFIRVVPYLDGNIEFVQTYNFFHGGLKEYFANWTSVHPPFKILLASFFYHLIGLNQFTYNLPGLILGISAIISLYLLVKNIFGKESAALSAILFSASPLFVATSIFMLRDYMLTALILISLYFYFEKRWKAYCIIASFAVLTKETGIILPVSLLTIEVISALLSRGFIIRNLIWKYAALLAPFLAYYFWNLALSSAGKSSWNDWIFTSNENKSAVYTIINNLKTFQFLNPYAYEHWKQLVFLNFNWVLLIIIATLFLYSFYKRVLNVRLIKRFTDREFFFILVILFSFIYLFTVLSLQTYTIPRYALPLIPFIVVSVSVAIHTINNLYIKNSLIVFIIVLTLLSLFFSLDPFANKIWGTENIMGKNIYSLRSHLAGNDGITYNIEYLQIASMRSEAIIQANINNSPVQSNYCNWIFVDPNNESKMLEILKLKTKLICNY